MIGNIAYTVAVLAVVLGLLVFVHELGHYIAAKAFGVWVHRFAIGIGKPIPGLTFQRGETQWAIAWLPIGGYVKMASREEEPASSVLEGGASAAVPPDRVFEAKPVWQRMVIILAGVTMNAVFAWLLFVGLAWKNGRHYDPTTTVGHVDVAALPAEAGAIASLPPGTRIVSIDGEPVKSWDDIVSRIAEGSRDQITLGFASRPDIVIPLRRDALVQRSQLATAIEPTQPAVLGLVAVNSPASSAGLMVNDSIVAVDGAPVTWWQDVVGHVEPATGHPVQMTVVRQGVRRTLVVTPRAEHKVPTDPKSPMVGRIGVGSRTPYLVESLGLGGAIRAGSDATASAASTIFRTLRGVASGQVSASAVGGPILVGQMAAQEARAGFDNLLAFVGLISINLAIVNLLPIPVLDGGAFVLLAIEGAIRRPLPVKLREVVAMVGLAMIVLLMVVVFKNDIARLLGR